MVGNNAWNVYAKQHLGHLEQKIVLRQFRVPDSDED
jgi:hypothetical protein